MIKTIISKFKKLSIYYKINATIIGIILMLSTIIGVIMIRSTAQILYHQLEVRGAQIASYIAALSMNDILLDDHYSLIERINKTKAHAEDIRYIIITTTAGSPLVHTFGDFLPEGLHINLQPQEMILDESPNPSTQENIPYIMTIYESNEGPIREIIVPIEEGTIGFIRVGMSEQETLSLLYRKINEFLLATLCVCILAAVISTYLAYVIIRPIRTLSHAVEQLSQGDFSATASVEAPDEIGYLAIAFNDMTKKIKEKQVENSTLLQELQEKEIIRKHLMQKLLTIQEDERKRISRELHDEAGQSLTSLLAYMKVLLSKLTTDHQKELLLGAREVALHVLGGIRKMAVELRPPMLDDLGIIAAMGKYINNYQKQHNININFDAPSEPVRLDSETSLALYRILQESLTNIVKHTKATSVDVIFMTTIDQCILIIKDNGQGIYPDALENARKSNHLGIYGMRERAELLGGSFWFYSPPNEGTTLQTILPLTNFTNKE